jgi:hypothetical protein
MAAKANNITFMNKVIDKETSISMDLVWSYVYIFIYVHYLEVQTNRLRINIGLDQYMRGLDRMHFLATLWFLLWFCLFLRQIIIFTNWADDSTSEASVSPPMSPHEVQSKRSWSMISNNSHESSY